MSTGENFYNIDNIIKSDHKYFIGYSHNEENYSYLKWKTIITKEKFEVWSIGSSRVLQFRENMFTGSFYNAGYTVTSIGDYMEFLKSIPKDKYPDVLLLGIDQWMFNENYDDLNYTRDSTYWKNSFVYFPKTNTYNAVITNFLSGKYSSLLNDINSDNKFVKKIGLNALVNNTGFRNDGSMYYGIQIKNLLNNNVATKDFGYKDTFKRIDEGNRKFQYGDSVNKFAIKKLDKLLKFCYKNNISVIGFLPPFAEKVNVKMEETKKAYERLKNAIQEYEILQKLPTDENFEEDLYTEIQKAQSGFYSAMSDDFNTPEALASLFGLV
ncbi:MAG: DALR domain-containing protein, partial [Candidatus Sericytochromatia bacterium]